MKNRFKLAALCFCLTLSATAMTASAAGVDKGQVGTTGTPTTLCEAVQEVIFFYDLKCGQ